jgi:Tol biopolymer transport system component
MRSIYTALKARSTSATPLTSRRVLVPFGVLGLLAAAACGSDSSGPVDPLANVPDFIYVSNASGGNELYTWRHGTTALFPATVAGDAQPQSAAGKVVFTSYRISFLNAEIYSANLDGSNAVRLTNSEGADIEPSLSPDGATVVFTSIRSGTSRIWTMGADGSSPTMLATGSATDLPESTARFSPDGSQILFSSPRTNTTQIWVMPAAGGAATQVTHEANGAFDGSWSSDGSSIYYVDGVDRTKIHNVVLSTGEVTDYVTGGTDVGEAACTTFACLVVSGATSSNGNILAYVGANSAPISILQTDNNEFEPAILNP